MMYKKLKPLTPRKRPKSTPGPHCSDTTQFPPFRSSIAEETLRNIDQFESSLKNKPSLPSVGSVEMPVTTPVTTTNVHSSLATEDVSIL